MRARPAVVVGAVAITAAAVLGAVFAQRRGRRPGGAELWTCDCGQRYLVRGVDRHRVYWLPDSAQVDPLLERECVSCGAPLPRSHDAATETLPSALAV